MDKIGRGIIAGFIATLILSAVIDPMAMLARMAGVLPPVLGWGLHFIVGSLIWGAGFAVVHDWLRGPSWLRGLVFGVAAWLLVLLAVMPLKHGGLFNLDLGIAAAGAMLVIHLVYGGTLGAIYGLIDSEEAGETRRDRHDHPRLHPSLR